MTEQPAPVHGCTINGQPAIPILISEHQQLTARIHKQQTALDHVREAVASLDDEPQETTP